MTEHLPKAVPEVGCFVYQVIGNSIGVRTLPNVNDEYRSGFSFGVGELVSVDRVQPSRIQGKGNGPFLRLSGGLGWLFEQKYGKQVMKRLQVEQGLWEVYVDNVSVGQALRKQPCDRSDLRLEGITYAPMQKIHCDRKVRHPETGVSFFRVQGTEGWLFDKRPSKTEQCHDTSMLLDEIKVRTGLFAFTALAPVAIRSKPQVGENTKTLRSVKPGEVVAVDVIRQSPFHHGNGPFLRLCDGSGWLFEEKLNQRIMQKILVSKGRWLFHIVKRIALRRHPIDNQWRLGIIYERGTIIACDRRVISSDGAVQFFRVEGTDGWVFDRRDSTVMMTEVSGGFANSVDRSNHSAGGWNPNFVREVAAQVPGLQEIAFNEESRLLSFRTRLGARVNVYYTTRTVGTCLEHPRQGKTQLFRRDCSPSLLKDILLDPRIHTGKGYQRVENTGSPEPENDLGCFYDNESELREDLLECDRKIDQLLEKRKLLLCTVREHDRQRAQEASEKMEKAERLKEEEAEAKKRIAEEAKKRIAEAEAAAARKRHIQTNKFLCPVCRKSFNYGHSLRQHQDALGHWG